jgi:hypothetical protein
LCLHLGGARAKSKKGLALQDAVRANLLINKLAEDVSVPEAVLCAPKNAIILVKKTTRILARPSLAERLNQKRPGVSHWVKTVSQ